MSDQIPTWAKDVTTFIKACWCVIDCLITTAEQRLPRLLLFGLSAAEVWHILSTYVLHR
jgi:hypothetical protein